jgi:hypothetical protein
MAAPSAARSACHRSRLRSRATTAAAASRPSRSPPTRAQAGPLASPRRPAVSAARAAHRDPPGNHDHGQVAERRPAAWRHVHTAGAQAHPCSGREAAPLAAGCQWQPEKSQRRRRGPSVGLPSQVPPLAGLPGCRESRSESPPGACVIHCRHQDGHRHHVEATT